MSNSFTQVFGGTTIYPADVSYLALALTGNISLEWPLEATAGSSVVARIIDITPSGAYTITMPEATSVSVGQTVLFNNIGPSTVAVNKANGSAILSIGAGEQWQAYLIDNTTPGGTWRTLRYGAATAQAQAAALAGPGLVTDGSQLAQNYEVIDFSVTPYTLTAPDRAKVFIWDGGLGTLNLPSAPAAGDGWFVQVRNAGQGDLTVDPSGSELINAGSTLLLQPGDSAVVVSNGTQWYTIGLGQQAVFAFDYTSIAVTGGTYTLTGSELNRIAYKFTGALASNVTIVVPATVQQYWVNNSTTGPFTLSLQASGSGSSTPVTQSSTSILYCDGTAIVPATTAVTFAGILPVSQGGTGANNAPSARTNLGATGIGSSLFTATSAASARSTISAASSGANSDITSLSGLTTPLSVGQGGTGAATLTANGVVVGNGTSAVQVTAAGTTGQVLVGNTGGAPSWATLTGIGVTSFSGGTTGLTPASPTTGAITLAGTLGVANGGTGTATAFTAGSVVFAGASGVYSQDNANLFWDDTNNRLGIGTAAPGYRLDAVGGNGDGIQFRTSTRTIGIGQVSNEPAVFWGSGTPLTFFSGSELMRITSAGNVGIGTSSPSYVLNTNYNANATFTNAGSDFTQMWQNSGVNALGVALADDLTARFVANNGYAIAFNSAANEYMRITAAGPVLIGLTAAYQAAANATNLQIGDPLTTAGAGISLGATTTNDIAFADNTTGTGQYAGLIRYSHTSDFMALWTASTERMRIDSAGNVGIGATTPTEKLQIQVNTGTSGFESGFTLTNGVDANLFNYVTGTAATDKRALITVGAANQSLAFGTLYTERMRIDASGNVGIGTTGPTIKLQVTDVDQATARIGVQNLNGQNYHLVAGNPGASNNGFAIFDATASATRMYVDSSGNVGIGTTSPTSKLFVEGTIQARNGSTGILIYGDGSGAGYIDSTGAGNPLILLTNGTERMRITSSGLVGIGTSPPATVLDIAANGGMVRLAGTAGNNLIQVSTGSGATGMGMWAGGNTRLYSTDGMIFSVNSTLTTGAPTGYTDAVVITSAGSVGIGTASPTVRLQVESLAPYQAYFKGTDAAGAGGIRTLNSGGTAGVALLTYGPSYVGGSIGSIGANGSAIVQTGAAPLFVGTDAGVSQPLYLGTNGSERMRIDTSGNVMIGTTAANNKFLVTYANPVSVPAAGAGGHCTAFGTVGYGLATGALTNGNVYLQATRWDTIATNYDLLLQPNGGNVGIGTSSPATWLDIAQPGNVTGGNIYLGSKADNFTKYTAIASTQYAYNSEPEGFAMIATQSSSTNENSVRIGGYIGELNAATEIKFFTAANTTTRAGSERMCIDGSGNVGIGTSSPQNKLVVSDAGAGGLEFIPNGVIQSYNRSGAGYQTMYLDAQQILFRPSGTEAMRVDASRNVLINRSTTSGYGKLNVDGGADFTGGDVLLCRDTGNVGIGTSSPGVALDVAGVIRSNAWMYITPNTGTDNALYRANNTGGTIYMGLDNSAGGLSGAAYALSLYHSGAYPIVFSNNATERARITAGGDLLVGATTFSVTPTRAEISAPADAYGLLASTETAAYAAILAYNKSTTGNNVFVAFGTEAAFTSRGTITYNRGAGQVSYNITSDYRAKDILGSVENSGATIDALKVHTGKMHGATIARPMLIAHEAQEVVPYAVAGEKDAVNEDGSPDYQQVDHQVLIPLLIAEIQSLRARVAQLEGK